jgi:hypothetical protein
MVIVRLSLKVAGGNKGLILRSGPLGRVSKDEKYTSLSWFETRAKSALLTMRNFNQSPGSGI